MEKQLNIALIGYGKMGRTIEKMARARQHRVALVIDNPRQWEGAADQLGNCDVAIEFTTPEAAPGNILTCFEHNVPVVSGTTGWLHELPRIARQCLAQNQALFHASNFSIGVNLFFELNSQLSKLLATMDGYSPRIIETHHTEKLDTPSGTAITLANDIIVARKDLNHWADHRHNLPEDALPVKSIRMDGITGTHVVIYESPIDSIEIKHIAHNRSGFAEGALMAARWIQNKKGVFTMKDLMNI